LGVSRSLLHKKLTSIADVSANDFITSIRLKKSALLLVEGKMNISEIAFSLGFNDPKYFSRCFKKQFGKPPKEYAVKVN
jgi:AraC-like DNA-binding protein